MSLPYFLINTNLDNIPTHELRKARNYLIYDACSLGFMDLAVNALDVALVNRGVSVFHTYTEENANEFQSAN